MNDLLTCQDCKSKKERKDILKIWVEVPFVNENNKTFYCGCRGWN